MKNACLKPLAPLLLALVLALSLLPGAALSESNARELAYAYLEASTPYFITGEEVTIRVMIPETAGLSYEFSLYYTPDRVTTETFEGIGRQKESKQDTFTFTPKDPGQYFVEAYIYDAEYRQQKLRSEPFYCYEPAAREDTAMLPGKVEAIVSEAQAQNFTTDYDKALWLHDWLTENADYDEPMTIHTPEGVLLQGYGVCESYALAYQMLLMRSGIESMYVTGYSRGESHAWNLVNLDGDWVYIDSTWDDPLGGEEGYDYFGLNDTLMARDHDWSYSNFKPPQATSLEHNYLLRNGAAPFADENELDTLLSGALSRGESGISYTYHGGDRFFDVAYAIQQWMKKNSRLYFVDSYQYGGSKYAGSMQVTYQAMEGYSRFRDEADFTAQMDALLPARPALVKMAYVGDDDYFDFGSFARGWLENNHRRYFVSSYSYNYLPFSGEITLEYKDMEGYTLVSGKEELARALEDILVNKKEALKLYYTGDDTSFRMRYEVDDWRNANRDKIQSVGGAGYTDFDADLTLSYR